MDAAFFVFKSGFCSCNYRREKVHLEKQKKAEKKADVLVRFSDLVKVQTKKELLFGCLDR